MNLVRTNIDVLISKDIKHVLLCSVNVYLLKPTHLEMEALPVVIQSGCNFPRPGGLSDCPGLLEF